MNRDDVIRMAREWLPNAYRDGDVGDEPRFTKYNMEVAFAAGAAAEREACTEVMRQALETIQGLALHGGCRDWPGSIAALRAALGETNE